MCSSDLAVYGGVSMVRQINALRAGVEIVVATPGRLNDLLERNELVLTDLEMVVIDEADQMADMADRFNQPLIDAIGVAPGHDVLDLASGTGEPALSLARRVGPSGQITATDLVPEMLEGAKRRARAAGLANIRFEAADMERLPFPDSSFDRLTCQIGRAHV